MKKLLLILMIGVVFMSCAKEDKVAVISTKFGNMIVEFFSADIVFKVWRYRSWKENDTMFDSIIVS